LQEIRKVLNKEKSNTAFAGRCTATWQENFRISRRNLQIGIFLIKGPEIRGLSTLK
jgi:hypothetical protein